MQLTTSTGFMHGPVPCLILILFERVLPTLQPHETRKQSVDQRLSYAVGNFVVIDSAGGLV